MAQRAVAGPVGGRALTRPAATLALAGALLAGAPAALRAQRPVEVPAGATLPIRFAGGVTSGKDPVGTLVVAQTLAALVVDSCVVVPPFVTALGHVTVSRGPGDRGRPGALEIRFTTLAAGRGERFAVDAVIDSLEYGLPPQARDSGLIRGGRAARAGRTVLPLALTAVAAATEVLTAPVALLSGLELLRRGPKVRIVAGEVGRLRLLAPLTLPHACTPLAAHHSLTEIPALPRFVPQTANRTGTKGGDPINLVLIGTGAELDAAFEAAGWEVAGHGGRALAREIADIVLGRQAYEAPVSTEYFEGRPQDVTWQLQGPSARVRHHVRFWLLDSTAGVWVGAAIKDVGVLVRPLHGTATHRVDPDADAERDFTVSALEAAGCARLLDHVTLPGAPRRGRDISGQTFVTDGRAAVVRLRRCDQPEPR